MFIYCSFIVFIVHLLYSFIVLSNHGINSNRGESYINSPDWIKNRIATINLINKEYNKWFQYVVTVALNHEQILKDLQIITKK